MILVTGANGVVGKPLCARLLADDMPFKAVSRKREKAIQWNLEDKPGTDVMRQLTGADTLVHCAPIWLLPRHLNVLHRAGVRRLVVFSSSSAVSKRSSMDIDERFLVEQLRRAEAILHSFCKINEMSLTIFRPSMIYGYGRDQNIMQIANFIRRFGFMLLVSKADGLRQPVHTDDLVQAILSAKDKPQTVNKVYMLAGAEELTYRQLVERIFAGLGKKPRILAMPLPVFRLALKLASLLTPFSYTAEMADRMRQDLNYKYLRAKRDFGYRPQPFLQNPQRDLPLPK